ncbi:PD-(D/E)XK nuclease family protein [Methanoculleus oceani]|uniref:ATP-dependent nuclease subunit B n=1 Tax=Methanoculleus oceani TaxID=2184756 RepID=A0ABD4TBD6_9EURY|nr:PD-(D/E)XK nuclease family protein [Methanoculleus sp. CWC-02]MCM2465972.1 ATP-dependent nuclease subunit B [Methanoculleus sp. CWC-02]
MSPAVLYRQLPGEGLDAFIAGFRKAAARDPFGTVFIVPTSHLAREVARRLGEEGVPFVADAVTTLPGFARKVFDDRATSEAPISSAESRLVLARLLAAGRYPLLAGAGAVDELATLFDVLIMRKVDYPAALGDLASTKSAEIARLFDAYLRFLDDHDLVDESTLFARAVRLLADAGGGFRTVFVYGLFEPVPLERDLLLSLRESAEEFHYSIPYAANPAVFSDDGEWLHPDEVVLPEDHPSKIAGLFSRREPGDCGGFIRIAERRDRLDEVRAIAQEVRDLIVAGARPGEIAVAFPDLASAVPYVEEVFPDFGIPYSASAGRPLSASPLVQALLLVPAVPARGYRREDVVALTSSPYLPNARGCEVDILSREARITGGAAAWYERLAALTSALEEERTRPDTPESARDRLAAKIAAIGAVRDGIRELFADLAALEGKKTLPGHLAAYRSLLDRWQAPAMPAEGDPDLLEDEARDLGGFMETLAALERLARLLPEEKVPLSEFSSLLGLFAAGTRTGRRRNSGAVRVVGVREIAHLAVPYLFIGDLVEGAMPRLTTRLPFTTDAETRRLATRSKEDILREERYHFMAALLAARSRVYLSYPAADGATPLIRSGFVDAVREAFSPETWGSGDFPDSALAAARRAGVLLARGETPAGMPPGLTIREAVRRLNVENYHRKGGYDSPYDGLLAGDPAIVAALAERFGDMAVFSPTALETYADCPFRFYLERALGLAPLPPADPDLTAQERGSLVHRIACRFYSGWKRDGNGAVTEACYPDALRLILSTGREEADRFAFTSPAWVADKEHLLGSPAAGRGLLERFLRHEAEIAGSGLLPQAFEVSFGLPLVPGEVDAASTTDAVAIPLGGETIRLRGRVDRVDVLPDGRFTITDYKTGTSHPGLKDIAAGKALQLPLYLRAVETLTGMEGVAGTYYTLRRGEVRNRPVFWDAGLKDCFACFPGSRQGGVEDVRELVETALFWTKHYLAGIRGGCFPPRSDAGPCPGYCGFKTVCRFDALRLLNAEVNADGTD